MTVVVEPLRVLVEQYDGGGGTIIFSAWIKFFSLRKRVILKFKESRYIALFVVSESIKKLFLIDYANIYFSNILLNSYSPVEKCWVTPH